ncbi:hypothetical protein HID58_082977, partial [Brassica napus]
NALNATGGRRENRQDDTFTQSPTRIPASERLGPPIENGDNAIHSNLESTRVPAKKRLGRPPLKNKLPNPLGVSTSAVAKKRRTTQVRISPKKTCPMAPWIISAIWTTRNYKVFQQREFSAQQTMTKAICDAK